MPVTCVSEIKREPSLPIRRENGDRRSPTPDLIRWPLAHGAPHQVSDAAAFDWLCTELESRSSLDRLEARGTIRIALKQSGLDFRTVTADQIQVVIDKVLPDELRSRGIEHGDVCAALSLSLKGQDFGGGHAAQSPDEIFRRLGGGQ